MDMSWSQTPNSVWWALEASASAASLTGLGDTLPMRHGLPRPGGTLGMGNNFYDYADDAELEEDEDRLAEWVREHENRGIVRVYHPGSSYSELIKCTTDTTAEAIMARCLSKELYVHYGSTVARRVQLEEYPLQLQDKFLEDLGHGNPHRTQVEGMKDDLAPLFKFVAGQERGNRFEDQVQLACALKVKELNSLGLWGRRFCVLCGARMFIFGAARPKGKPTLVLDLTGGNISEYKSKKHFYCVRITASRREVVLAFESRLEQTKWLERASKVVSKHPLEANLANCNLEKVPKYFFLNSNLIAMNLSHNHMQESFEQTDAAILGHPRTVGWISDLAIFHRLISLSLSDNDLQQFPVSLCFIPTLQELDLSCNHIKVVPQEVQRLTSLTTLLLHSNHLTSLPYCLGELDRLSILVIAFNKFSEIPGVVKELSALAAFVASGNSIGSVPADLARLHTLQHFDLRLNRIKTSLPPAMAELRNLVRFNIRGNGIKELNMQHFQFLEELNCSDNSLRALTVTEGPLRTLLARNNFITQLALVPTCDQLTSMDISKNELTSLPEALSQLKGLETLNASSNKLTALPQGIFTMESLKVLRVSDNRLVSLPQAVGHHCLLRLIDLHRNQLTALPPQLLANINGLEELNVSSNQLSALPPANLMPEKNIVTQLYASCNRLGEGSISNIAGYHSVKVLHLAYNHIRSIHSGFFSQLRDLEYLNLSGNSLSSLPPIPGCLKLYCLLLHSNHLSSLPMTPSLKHLHTVDLGCNKFETIPKVDNFPHLKVLDLCGNSSLVVDSKAAEKLKNIPHCLLEGVREVAVRDGTKHMVTGSVGKDGKWSYGSASIIGVSSRVNNTAQLKATTAPPKSPPDGVFAVMDGGRAPDVPEALKTILSGILTDELANDEDERRQGYHIADPLQYLTHTFLSAHRQLGDIGQKFGASVVLCHLREGKTSGGYMLNVANTGLGEAILCRSGRAVPLTTPHLPATNAQERVRVASTRGFISQDNRVNGVCGTTRLLGCYYLWPQVIPTPSTESVKIMPGDEHVILGTDSLWKFVSYEEAVHTVQRFSDPIPAAKYLRDLAVAHGCSRDVSVLVIKLNLFSKKFVDHNIIAKPQSLPEPEEEEEEEEEDVEFTNIDDILSDTEDDSSPPPANTWSSQGRQSKHQPTKEHNGVDQSPLDDLDQLVLSAVSTPTSSPNIPSVESTNIDDLLLDESPIADTEDMQRGERAHPHPSTPIHGGLYKPGSNGVNARHHRHIHVQPSYTAHRHSPSKPPYSPVTLDDKESSRHRTKKTKVGRLPQSTPTNWDDDYPAQTLPKAKQIHVDAHRQRYPEGSTIPKRTALTYEQTQSVPALDDASRRYSEGDVVDTHLARLNEAMSHLDREVNPVPIRERAQSSGAKIVRRLSYVEHSYHQLTKDSRSSNSLMPASNTVDLDEWAWT